MSDAFNIPAAAPRELGQKILEEIGRETPSLTLLNKYVMAGAHLEEKDADGNTPLLLAALHDHTAAALLLIASGADVHAMDNQGNLPFTHADTKHNLALMKELIDRDAARRPGTGDVSFISSEMWDRHMENLREKIADAEAAEAKITRFTVLRPLALRKLA